MSCPASTRKTSRSGTWPRCRRWWPAVRRFPACGLRSLLKGSFLESVLPTGDLAYAAVALYFGIETLTHLDGDRSRAEALFDTGRQLAPIADAMLAAASWTGDQP